MLVHLFAVQFLGRYKMGEARLAEIMEGLCSKSDDKCNALMEDLEEPLEEWWGLIVRFPLPLRTTFL